MATLSRAEIEDIADTAATKACEKMLVHLGIEVDNHQATRRDFEFLRDWRRLCEMSKRRGTIAVVTILVGTVFTLLVTGLSTWILSFR